MKTINKAQFFSALFFSICSLSHADADFDASKKKAISDSKPHVSSLQKLCKSKFAISINWNSFKNSTEDMVIIPNVFKEVYAGLKTSGSSDSVKTICTNLKTVRISSNRKTVKTFNRGLLSVSGNEGSQTITASDFQDLLHELINFRGLQKRVDGDMNGLLTRVKRSCEKKVAYSIDWGAPHPQKFDYFDRLEKPLLELTQAFSELIQNNKMDPSCDSLKRIEFSVGKTSSIKFKKGLLSVVVDDQNADVFDSNNLASLLAQGEFKEQRKRRSRSTASTSGSSSKRSKTEVEQEAESLARETKQRGKSKLRDNIKKKIFKLF